MLELENLTHFKIYFTKNLNVTYYAYDAAYSENKLLRSLTQ